MKLHEQLKRMKTLSGLLTESDNQSTLMTVEARVKPYFDQWILDNELDITDEEERLHELENYLYDEFTLRLEENGCFSFYRLEPAVKKIISEFPIQLYHFTSSNLVESIRQHGLQTGHHQTNPHKNSYAGIYLTTEDTGPAIQGYKYHAIQKHGGEAVKITVKTFLNEIAPDPDDADLASGNVQFISAGLGPDRILEIEEVW